MIWEKTSVPKIGHCRILENIWFGGNHWNWVREIIFKTHQDRYFTIYYLFWWVVSTFVSMLKRCANRSWFPLPDPRQGAQMPVVSSLTVRVLIQTWKGKWMNIYWCIAVMHLWLSWRCKFWCCIWRFITYRHSMLFICRIWWFYSWNMLKVVMMQFISGSVLRRSFGPSSTVESPIIIGRLLPFHKVAISYHHGHDGYYWPR